MCPRQFPALSHTTDSSHEWYLMALLGIRLSDPSAVSDWVGVRGHAQSSSWGFILSFGSWEEAELREPRNELAFRVWDSSHLETSLQKPWFLA